MGMMNREETLDWLYRLRSEIYVYMPKEWLIPMNNALDMVIKELEQKPTTKNDLGVDCISRKEVLRLLANNVGKTNTYLQTKVLRMPSVTPQEPKVDLDELKQHFYELSYALDSHSAFKEYEELRRTHHENIGWMESKGLEEEYYKVLFEHIKAKDEENEQ